MNRTWVVFLASGLIAGCQAKPATPPAALTPPAPAAKPAAVPPPADARVQDVTKLVEAEAKSIERVPAAPPSTPPSNVIEPGKPAVAPPPKAPAEVKPPPAPVAPKGPAVAAVERAIADAPPAPKKPADDGFKPVPPMSGVITPADVAIVPPADVAVTPPPAVVDPTAPPAAKPADAAAPPVGVVPPANAVAPAAAEPLEKDLTQKARKSPHDLAPQLDQQLYLLLQDAKVPTDESMAGLNAEDREVLTGLLDGLTNFRNGVRQGNNALLMRKIQPLVAMIDRLRSRADMTIVNANLCKNIRGFGNFDAITPLKLPAGVNLKPKLYFEVENITPRLDAAGMWATVMRLDLTLFDSVGMVKWTLPNLAVTDLCKNRRRDFFYGCILNFPLTLVPDNYTLKLTLTDEVAKRVTELGIPVAIVPPGGVQQQPPAGPPLPR